MNIFRRFNAEHVGYRVAKALRAELNSIIRSYEAEHGISASVSGYHAVTEDQLATAVAGVEGDKDGAVVVPLRVGAHEPLFAEIRGLIEQGALRGLILFRVFADGGYDHVSVSEGGSGLEPQDYALAGAALTQVAMERAGWAMPYGVKDDGEGA